MTEKTANKARDNAHRLRYGNTTEQLRQEYGYSIWLISTGLGALIGLISIAAYLLISSL